MTTATDFGRGLRRVVAIFLVFGALTGFGTYVTGEHSVAPPPGTSGTIETTAVSTVFESDM